MDIVFAAFAPRRSLIKFPGSEKESSKHAVSQLFGRPHAGGEGAGSRLASGLADLLLYGEHGVPGRVEQHAGEKGYAGQTPDTCYPTNDLRDCEFAPALCKRLQACAFV